MPVRNGLQRLFASLILAFVPPQTATATSFFEPGLALEEVHRLAEIRLAQMDDVAAWKWLNGISIRDSGRERDLLERVGVDARALGLQPEPIIDWFALQMARARDRQQKLILGWTTHPERVPDGALRSLAQIRQTLDQLGIRILKQFYLLADSDEAGRLLPDGLGRLRTPSLTDIKQAGILRIGVTGDYPPFSLDRQGILTGFDVGMGLELADRLGLEPVFIGTRWATLETDLLDGRFDIAMGGITVTQAREKLGVFSATYHRGGKTAIAACSLAAEFSNLVAIDRPGVRVIVNPGGTNERFARATLRHAEIVVHTDNLSIFDQLLAGSAQLMITDAIEVELQRRRDPRLCRTTTDLFTGTAKAYLMPKHSDLAPIVNEWLGPDPERSFKARLESALGEFQ